MRIETLEFTAVGPYPNKVEIDFSALDFSALYLIDGPTGAGKTTIIDAITYGLYAQVSGEANADEKLRSIHAAPGVVTEVKLRFTVPAGTYEVIRRPKQQTIGRADKVSETNATCTVNRINPDGSVEPVESQVKAANAELRNLIGLEPEQFKQTVVLPQGEFATFLKASSKDRQPILQKIFNTKRYQDIELKFKERASAVSKQNDQLKQAIVDAINVFKGAQHLDDEFTAPLVAYIDTYESSSAIHALDEYAVSSNDTLKIAQATVVPIEAAHAANDKALREREAERKAQADLVQALAQNDLARNTLFGEMAQLSDKHDKALRDALVSAETAQDIDRLTAEVATINGLIQDLQIPDNAEQTLDALKQSLQGHADTVVTVDAQLKSADEELKGTIPAALTAAEKSLDDASKAELTLKTVDADLEKIEHTLAVQDELKKASAALSVADAAVADAEAKWNKADQTLNNLMDAHLLSSAALLAAQLQAGEECMVCGSLEHPKPAKASELTVTAEEVQLARDNASSFNQVLVDAKTRQAACAQTVESLTETLKGFGAFDQKKYDDLTAQRDALQTQMDQLDALVEAVQSIKNRQAALNDEIQVLIERKTKATTQVAGVTEQIAQSEALIAQHKHEFASIAERLDALRALVKAIEGLGATHKRVTENKALLAQAQATFEALPQHEHFADIPGAQAAFDESKAALEQAQAELNDLTRKNETAQKQIEVIKTCIDTWDRAVVDSRVVTYVADLINGKNDLKMNLSTYVLTTLFQDVVAAANVRLAGMLEGRYSLLGREEGDNARGLAGLNLRIVDNHAESDRPVTTLSGGESFCVSLALALGLAETVQANQGGIAIDTLFIDEGFGTLDGSRLDDVMNVLTKLNEHGRTVGLISHVSVMKDQIQEKITVTPNLETGQSTLAVSWMS